MKYAFLILAIVAAASIYAVYPQDIEVYRGTVSTNEVQIVFSNSVRYVVAMPDPDHSEDVIYVRFHTNAVNTFTVDGVLSVSRTSSRLLKELWIKGNGTNTHYQILTQASN